MLTRENIRSGVIQRMLAEGDSSLRLLSDEERDASLSSMLVDVAPDDDVWVFAYGSLIWNPAFHFVEKRIATVHGWHRRFCLWVQLGRGSPENPGLMLGLERGGSCRGLVYRVARPHTRTELEIVWRREMVAGAYRPRWVAARTAEGEVRAITFAINDGHDRYAGGLSDEEAAAAIATAKGADRSLFRVSLQHRRPPRRARHPRPPAPLDPRTGGRAARGGALIAFPIFFDRRR